MKIWKVILATLVIFAAGAVAGGIWVKMRTPPATVAKAPQTPAPAPVPPIIMQQRFQEKLKKELQLTEEQTNRMDKIFHESNARIKILWDLVGPEMQKERQDVYEGIRGMLSPEQRDKFEHLLKQRSDGQRRSGSRSNLNQTNSSK